MARHIPEDHNYRTACPAAVKAKITALENAVLEYARVGEDVLDPEGRRLSDAQFRRYCLEQTVLTCIENAVAEAHQAVRRHAAYHVSEVEGCLDEYEDMPCTSLFARLRGALNKAKATFS